MQILIVDNYDSFTYNLYHLFLRLGACITVRRNDDVDSRGVLELSPDLLVISPGPKNPSESGNTKEIIRNLCQSKPIFGVCLGMQAINEVFGGRTIHAAKPVHGKTSLIYHGGEAFYSGIPSPFRAARYHSLVCSDIPGCLQVLAHTADGVPMALMHRELHVCGVQYHPESFLTEYSIESMKKLCTWMGLYDASIAQTADAL